MAPITSMDILTALGKADAQSLAAMGLELLASLSKAEATIEELRRADDARRAAEADRLARDRERKRRRVHGNPRKSTEFDGSVGPSPFSPTPPLTPTSSSSSSSPRAIWMPIAEQRIAE